MQERRYITRNLEAECARHAGTRKDLVALLSDLTPSGWDRTGRIADYGSVPLRLYAAHVAAEDIDHLGSVQEARPGGGSAGELE